MTVAVVYIARGSGAGLPAAKAFFEAYKRFPPGYAHRLVIVVKGWESVPGLSVVMRQARSLGAELVMLPDDGFDWGAYMRVAPSLSDSLFCFLNTHSRPMVSGWLASLIRHVFQKGVGAVGSTGSWGTLTGMWPLFEPDLSSRIVYPARLTLEFIRMCRNLRDFPIFPNPHLRSNAILVRKELFVPYCNSRSIPSSKRDAHIMESGRSGFTAYIRSLGLQILVAGADGHAFAPEEWIDSGTFRVPHQSNLLVSDNQTRNYEKADQQLKRRLENAAWGQALTLNHSIHSANL